MAMAIVTVLFLLYIFASIESEKPRQFSAAPNLCVLCFTLSECVFEILLNGIILDTGGGRRRGDYNKLGRRLKRERERESEMESAQTPKVVAEAEELPKAIVRRVVKEKLSHCSDTGDISLHKDALLAFSESARIFIHYLSATANDICKESRRQTISADDVLKAVEEIEFPEFAGPLKSSLEEFRRKNAGKRAEASKAKELKKRKTDGESSKAKEGSKRNKDGGDNEKEETNGNIDDSDGNPGDTNENSDDSDGNAEDSNGNAEDD